MSELIMTEYYDEFCRYFKMAKLQQENCNLGDIPHNELDLDDDLIQNVKLYDVVERKYAGFSQIINDIFYGQSIDHPYYNSIKNNTCFPIRKQITSNWNNKTLNLEDWIYLFILHRVTGSAIHYGKIPSGYHNTILVDMHQGNSINEFVDIVKLYKDKTFYTSIGYQIARFPKPPKGSPYNRGGDYYLCEYAPNLARDLTKFLTESSYKKNFREIGTFMFNWNQKHDLVRYKFQYSAVIADIADWLPDLVNRESLFYYGSNAVECISYLAKTKKRIKKDLFLDKVMLKIYQDLDSLPYNAEDVACDFIRYISNYIKPGDDYKNLDLDKVWNSSSILDHPYGRQKAMLELGLVESFNNIDFCATKDNVIKKSGLTEKEYKLKVKQLQV